MGKYGTVPSEGKTYERVNHFSYTFVGVKQGLISFGLNYVIIYLDFSRRA